MRLKRSFILVTAIMTTMADLALGDPVLFGFVQLDKWDQWESAKIDFSAYTHVNIAFAIPQQDTSFVIVGEEMLAKAVETVHAKNTKVLLSYGGWAGSANFSAIVADEAKMDTMINNMVEHVRKYQLDGIDIDWEYPGRAGDDCNVFDAANDTHNLDKLVKEIKRRMADEHGANTKLITLAVATKPVEGPQGPVGDVGDIPESVDYIALMQYDMSAGMRNSTGPNAPLNLAEGKGTQVSFVLAIEAWEAARWPVAQMVAGFAFYARASVAQQDMTINSQDMYQPKLPVAPPGDKDNQEQSNDVCSTEGEVFSGAWMWRNLRGQGVLIDPLTANADWTRIFDVETQTPWLFIPVDKMFMTYDDPQSLQAKASLASSRGLAGGMIWSIDMDTPDLELTRTIKDNWKVPISA